MSEPFLILHRVRGEPAFDIAIKTPCAVCGANPNIVDFSVPTTVDCHECEGFGHWWIIPTSGHRAYPYFNQPLKEIIQEDLHNPILPKDWPDHYAANNHPAKQDKTFGSSLLDKLGLGKRVERRI